MFFFIKHVVANIVIGPLKCRKPPLETVASFFAVSLTLSKLRNNDILNSRPMLFLPRPQGSLRTIPSWVHTIGEEGVQLRVASSDQYSEPNGCLYWVKSCLWPLQKFKLATLVQLHYLHFKTFVLRCDNANRSVSLFFNICDLTNGLGVFKREI